MQTSDEKAWSESHSAKELCAAPPIAAIHPYPIGPNPLLEREPPVKPNEVWVGDITYIPLSGGRWAYLSVWMDRYSPRVVGWQSEGHMREELVITALQKALQTRETKPRLVVHSDRGGQYTGGAFRKLLRKRRIEQSMSRADDPYDNAFMESCFGRFKAELLEGEPLKTWKSPYRNL